jgi:cyclic pyranopterin phosphate synthase
LTGGEPLLRRELVDIVAALAALRPRPRLALTTNGIGLDRLAGPLKAAGLDRVNVSIDTVDPDAFARITRRVRLDTVLVGIAAAAAAGLTPVKLNAVVLRDINDGSRPAELLAFAMRAGYELRFIEQMPLDPDGAWNRSEMVTAGEIQALLEARWRLTPLPGRGSAPAERFLVDDGPATVGIIASVTRPFCAACDRLRLTADGQIRNCLFATSESDLRSPLRAGASDVELGARLRAAIAGKKAGHGIDDPTFVQPTRPMSAIGG